MKQLGKLVDVIESKDNSETSALERELTLVKVEVSASKRQELLQIIDHFKGKTIDITDETIIAEVSGGSDKISAFIELMAPFKVIEMVRSGKMVMQRGLQEEGSYAG